MLQTGGVLTTWSLSQPPASPGPIPARALPDHRPDYLDYEGPISGGRGAVTRWDQGTYQLEHQEPGQTIVLLQGEKLTGRAVLQRSGDDPRQWTVSFHSTRKK
jgi:hypothetical protein